MQILSDKVEIALLLAAQYELGEIDTISHLLANEPERNDLLKIECAARTYALKLQAANKREAQFILEARLLFWLQNNAFGLVPPVMLAKGGMPFGSLNEQRCLLTGFVPAHPVYDWRDATWGAAVCRQGAESLAHLHNHLATLPTEQIKEWGYDVADAPPSLANQGRIGVGSVRPRIGQWLNQAIDDFCLRHGDKKSAEERQSRVGADGSADSLDAEVCRSLLKGRSSWMRLLECAEANLQRLTGADEMAMVHGDFHPGNALWSGERVVAIIDFENSHLEHPLYDVAYSMIMFSAGWHRAITFGTETAFNAVSESHTDGPTEGKTDSRSGSRTSFSREFANDFLTEYLKHSQVVGEQDCAEMLRSFLQLAGSVILYWMLAEHQKKGCYRNLIEFLVANLEGVSHLAGV